MTGRPNLAAAHRLAQSMLAEFDGGREVGYPEFVDELFALAYLGSPIHRPMMGAMACENSLIWDRIIRKSASLAEYLETVEVAP